MHPIPFIIVHLGPKKIEHILNDCLDQLLRAHQDDAIVIYLYITDKTSISEVSNDYLSHEKVKIVTPAEVPQSEQHKAFAHDCPLDRSFGNGYWVYCSQRFFAIHEVMLAFDLKNAFHIETDVLVYWPVSKIMPAILSSDMDVGVTPLNPSKIVPGIMYFRDASASAIIADGFTQFISKGENDMYVLGMIMQQSNGRVKALPVAPEEANNPFGVLFDGASIGQWIGGTDPVCGRQPFDAPFYNYEATYRYDTANITFDDLRRPHANGTPIFNMHVHSKQLWRWKSLAP